MDAYREVFLAESADYLQQIVDGLLALEAAPHDYAPVETIFRGAHSLKGMSAAMGYDRAADLTHRMESLMDRVRKGELVVSSGLVNLMLTAVDLTKDLIEDEASGQNRVDPSEVLAALSEALESGPIAGSSGEEDAPHVAEAMAGPAATVASSASGAVAAGGSQWRVKVTLDEACALRAVRAYMVIKRLSYMGRIVQTTPSVQDIEDEKFDLTFEAVVETPSSADQVREAAAHVAEVADVVVEPVRGSGATGPHAGSASAAPAGGHGQGLPRLSEAQTVRVSIGHLDTLVDLVGELVILRSRLEGVSGRLGDAELRETVDELQRISTDLQWEVMQTRMVPVGNIFNRFPRMVRDLAADLGKKVDFRMEGLDIELDRTVLDEIGDPLVHLLRNCIDHGIEPVAERQAAGKPPFGRITLSASRERDHVAIVVSDDGRGIDIEKVWGKALERGLVSPEDRCDYDESDILQMTCLPGFTTMDTANKVSGRGVGMDAVKGKIEHLGGSLIIRSQVGVGTEFVLRLPLTLAIVQALLVRACGQLFAIPLASVDEVFSSEDVTVDTVDGSPVVILRDGAIVPLQRMDALLFDADPRALPEPRSSVVLVDTGVEQRALHVDGLAGRQEIVVKPLTRLFREQKGFSGATILGDGRVLLIFDPRALSSSEV